MGLLKLKSKAGKVKRRVGRGNASGAGTYSGRGMKGQSSRSGGRRRPGFEGGQTPLIRKMPKLKGFRNPCRVEFQVVNVSALEKFEDGEVVNLASLYEKRLISKKDRPVKILGNGDLTKKLEVKVDKVSVSAREKIEKAKGSVTELMTAKKEKKSKEENRADRIAKRGGKVEKVEKIKEKEETIEEPKNEK